MILAMIEAGFQTTSAALQTLILYLSRDPDLQDKATQEIESLVEPDRMPISADISHPPYIKSCVKEVFRIAPLKLFGTPHYTIADIHYKQHLIPKGPYVVINQAALHFDSSHFSNPHVFNSSRYAGHIETSAYHANNGDPELRDHYSIGSGRRVCPEIHLAESNMCITLARLLCAFGISAPPEQQHTSVSTADFVSGANSVPRPFAAHFTPRSSVKAKMVQTQWFQAQSEV